MMVTSLPAAQPVGGPTPASPRVADLGVGASAGFEETLLDSEAAPVARDLEVVADPVFMNGMYFLNPPHVPGDATDAQIPTQERSQPADDLEQSLAPFYDLAFGQTLTMTLPRTQAFDPITQSVPANEETFRAVVAASDNFGKTAQPIEVSGSAREQPRFDPLANVPVLMDGAKVLSVSSKAFHAPFILARPAGSQIPAATLEDVVGNHDPVIGNDGSTNDRSRGFSVVSLDRMFATAVPIEAVDSQQSRLNQPVANSHIVASLVGSSAKPDWPQPEMGVRTEGTVVQQLTSAFQSLLEGDGGVATEESGPTVANGSFSFQPKLRVLDIVLQPQELGRVSIRMRLSGSGLSVLLEAENAATRQLLQQEAGLLSERMSADGYDVENFAVQQLFITPPPTKPNAVHGPVDVFQGPGGGAHPGAGGAGGQGAENQRPRNREPVGLIEGTSLAEPDEPARDARNHLYV